MLRQIAAVAEDNEQNKQRFEDIAPPTRRTREEILREIKLALATGADPLLDERRERSRGNDPYDSLPGDPSRHVWRPRRRD